MTVVEGESKREKKGKGKGTNAEEGGTVEEGRKDG